MDSALETAVIAAAVSLSVSFISPSFTHHLWKRQKRKEQQLAVAERFAVLIAELAASIDIWDRKATFKRSPAETELIGILYVVPVLFEKRETIERAQDLLLGKPSNEGTPLQRIKLQAYLFAEALSVSFKKIPALDE